LLHRWRRALVAPFGRARLFLALLDSWTLLPCWPLALPCGRGLLVALLLIGGRRRLVATLLRRWSRWRPALLLALLHGGRGRWGFALFLGGRTLPGRGRLGARLLRRLALRAGPLRPLIFARLIFALLLFLASVLLVVAPGFVLRQDEYPGFGNRWMSRGCQNGKGRNERAGEKQSFGRHRMSPARACAVK
jgi:hypothetical protein